MKLTTEHAMQPIAGSCTGNFFHDFAYLLQQQSLLPVTSFYGNENAQFSDGAFGAKNVYLAFDIGGGSSNVAYTNIAYDAASEIYNATFIGQSEHVYESFFVYNSQKVFYSSVIRDCADIYSSHHLQGCHHCINCHGLTNQSYCINNQPVTPSQFEQECKVYAGTYHPQATIEDTIHHCQDCDNIRYAEALQDCRNVIFGAGGNLSSHMYNCVSVGLNSQRLVGCIAAGDGSSHLYHVAEAGSCSHCFYCYHIESCSYCLGCIGLKNKQFCILNKQYTKEERHQKVDQIFAQMDADGTLGAFFPPSMNPFYFNDTAAYLIDDTFTKEEVTKLGYLWRDEKIKVDIPEGMIVVQSKDLGAYESLDGGARTINPDILNVVIQDPEGNYYRIVKMEYDFLVKHGLPLPRQHRLTRLKAHFTLKN